jgi:hypothetical protein
MKRLFAIGVLLVTLIGAGVASVKLRRTQSVFVPHTITYRLTIYDQAGKVAGTDVLVRRVLADGTWNHTQIRMDGSVLRSNGKLKGPLPFRQTDANSPRHLNFAYYEEMHPDQAWVSPDLQDYLMFTAIRDDGSRESRLEAIDISTP